VQALGGVPYQAPSTPVAEMSDVEHQTREATLFCGVYVLYQEFYETNDTPSFVDLLDVSPSVVSLK
jgi:hypothetical protein